MAISGNMTYEELMGGGAGNGQQQAHQAGNPMKAWSNAIRNAITKAAAAPVPATPMQQIETKLPGYIAPQGQIQSAMQSMLPAYQARLGGFDSQVAQAMRNKGQQNIQSQYGSNLRAAINQAGQQGIRGPAAAAMQNDIRNQMGQATAGFERDLNIANWDAGRQALGDYYGAATGERAMDLGSLAGLQQLANSQQAGTAYQQGLQNMNTGGNAAGVGGIWNQYLNPLTSVLSPFSYLSGRR